MGVIGTTDNDRAASGAVSSGPVDSLQTVRIRAVPKAKDDLERIVSIAEKRGEIVAGLFRIVIFAVLASVDLGEGLSLPTNHPFVAVVTAYGLVSLVGLYLAWRDTRSGILPYLLASIDVIALAVSISMVERMIGFSHEHAISLPMSSLIFLMLIHASMRYKAGLVVYAAAVFVAALLLFDWLMSRAPLAGPMAAEILDSPGAPAPWALGDLLHYRSGPIVFVSLAAILLFYITRRTRHLLREGILQERKVARLSRFFPQTVVAQLAAFDSPIRTPRTQRIAVLFADVVGFTRLVETASAADIMAFLRDFHHLMERTVFDNGGTLEKFLGDGVMATFGTPTVGPRDATNALSCGLAMLEAVDHWNRERRQHGLPSVRLSTGIHYGEVLLGEIGSARRLELAVVGDVVNVASRLEALTRPLDCSLVISDDLLRAVEREGVLRRRDVLPELRDVGLQALQGRAEHVAVWAWTRR